MQYVGPLALALTIALLVAVSVATGERGYCRMIHLVAKPLGLGAIAIWLLWWGRRADFAAWTLRQKLAWTGLFIAVFLFHAYGAMIEAPPLCNQPVCAEADGPEGWLRCLAARWQGS
jgi:hypothetical protein